MYIVNEKEKISYLKALVYIATIDEDLGDDEKQYLVNISNMYGLTEEQSEDLIKAVIDRTENLEEILSEITDRKTKLLLIYELIALCYADGNYSEIEKSGVINVSKILKIEEGKIKVIEDLLNESVKLQEKVNIALER
nr:TerB family tellurite resistance protein [Clostridium algidicarnis]